ncbi:restriction system modified-DNA reader domain-containing protein [Mucilaginibacter glaciei]|uniref:RAMA domain-containing protein n=1 Tax=Mucilaginibacter glaciei TaxID=2772109 RepID=A0A926S3R1_9SPHI|nr:hypothetical protein [Mucilaginibacter glaciei]MBD1395498.1 hypothetical protein [Mucilaginibacter glaciei]
MKFIEQQDITLEMVINAGLLKPGIILNAASDTNITGILNIDGSIELIIKSSKKVFPSPSGVARAVRNISVSGWVFWKVLEGEKFVERIKYKQKYLSLTINQIH